ncbi:Sulfotransferase domain protein [Methyloligella halotolerans]|uniref:Sulfotransferase domain protein n=1 Tax=Methyloligella halotolerans TaxID=1177755 RepID=A0A1E2S2W7_9HYPH|nr:sulfotransferase domain-containing protein [Methyloligella halotolerans]ODA68669.1 Sulfotransferase domain protein [Methyloligella halotolerans]
MIIWLASYPRSGNTFFRSVLKHYFDLQSYSIHGDHRDIGANEGLGDLVGHMQGDKGTLDLDALRHDREIHVVKTHDLPCEYMQGSDEVIYVSRDGRDATTSYLKYLHRVAGLPATSLEDVIAGKVPFGFWGNHVHRWRQAVFDRIQFFRFEEITADPYSLADRLAESIGRGRSREPFPDFNSFKESAPNFFGSGKSGNFANQFSEEELALFELYSGPAMRLAGYSSSELDENEVAAYGAFCANVTDGNSAIGEAARLRAELQQARKRYNSAEQALQKERKLRHELSERHDRLRRYTGLELYRKVFPK